MKTTPHLDGFSRRTFAAALAALAMVCSIFLMSGPSASAGKPKAGQDRPNIVLIQADDAVVSDLQYMPNTRKYLINGGTRFSNFFVPYPLCCTARTNLLTGQFAHNHGVESNFRSNEGGYYKIKSLPGKRNIRNTLGAWLQKAGYRTALVGKFLNEYGALNRREIPPGWNYWAALLDNSTYDYFNYAMNVNGNLRYYGDRSYALKQLDMATTTIEDPPENFVDLIMKFRSVYSPWDYFGTQDESVYTMDVGGKYASGFVRGAARSKKPFFLYYSPPGPHAEDTNHIQGLRPGAPGPDPRPPARYRDTFDDVELPRTPSFNEADVSDKAANLNALPLLKDSDIATLTENYRGRLGAVRAIDDQVGKIVTELKRAGEFGKTFLIFESDNGYLQGEHRLKASKFLPYENSIRVPALIAGPGVGKNATLGGMAMDVDLAPTILDMANAEPGRLMDGVSLLPAATKRRGLPERKVPLEALRPLFKFDTPLTMFDLPFYGVRTDRYKYIKWSFGGTELYDLREDPDELVNLASDPANAALRDQLDLEAKRLGNCQGSSCR